MRKAFTILLICVVVLCCVGCSATNDDAEEYYGMQGSKDSVADFITLQGELTGEGLLTGYDFSADTCYNITPEIVSKETDCMIFKFADSCASFLLYDNLIYPLGEFFGGLGIVDIKLCDFDNNGKSDLLYTYSWGSGLHRSLIGHFNLETRKETTLDYAYLNEDMVLKKTAQSEFSVYHADVEIIDGNFANLECTKGTCIANIVYENNIIIVEKISE